MHTFINPEIFVLSGKFRSLYFEIKLSNNCSHQLVPYFRGCGSKFNMESHVGCTNNPTLIYELVVYIQLDMSMACRRLKSPRSLSGTSAHPTMVTQVNIMVMNGWLTSFLFIVKWPSHSWDKAISDSDLETQRSLPFHFTSIRPTIPEIELFQNSIFKHPRSRSWVMSKVKVIYCTQYPTNALPFCFTSIGPTIPEIRPK